MFNNLLRKYYILDDVELNPGTGGSKIGVDNIGGVDYEVVKQAFGAPGSLTLVSPADPLPVTDAAVLAALATLNAEDFATESTLAAVLAKLSNDPATQTTLAAVLAKLIANPATDTLQTTGNSTLASILAKIIAAPSTEAKQDAIITLLTSIDDGTAAALGQALMAASVPVTIASDQSAIPVTFSGLATDNTTLYSNTLNAVGAISGILTTGYSSIIFSFSGVWAGNLLVEGSEDNSIWEQKIVLDVNEFAMQDVINENGIFQIKCSSKYIRLNVQRVDGTITALIVGRTIPGLNAADSIAFAMDKSFNMPLYVEETATRKDSRNALIPSDAPAPIYGSAVGINSVLFLVDTTGYQSVVVQVLTLGSNITIQTSNDGITWASLFGYSAILTNTSQTITSSGVWEFPALGKFVRGLMAGAGFTNCLVYLRQKPANQFNVANGAGINIQSIGGSTPAAIGANLSTNASTTINGGIVIGSNQAPASTTVPYPIIVGGREAASDGALSGKVRTLLTDTLGKAIVTGDISANQSNQNVKSVPVADQSQFEGQSMIEIMAQVLLELRILNQNISELPIALQSQNGTLDEPLKFRNDPTVFAN